MSQAPTMNPEAQRIAIAEACGARWYVAGDETLLVFRDEKGLCWPDTKIGAFLGVKAGDGRPHKPLTDVSGLPDYLNDLDAMHEAEKTLVHYQIGVYQDWVRKLVPNPPEHVGGFFALIHTAAAYRAEAFLRTLNLWVES